MNIKVDRKFYYDTVISVPFRSYTVGSVLYETNTKGSDLDNIIVTTSSLCETGKKYQFTDEENGESYDYTIMNEETFLQKAKSGDDLVCFEAYYMSGGRDFNVPKVIRAYSGIAHRDLKEAQKKLDGRKLYHAVRCQFIVEQLLLSNNVDIKTCARDAYEFADCTEIPDQIVDRIMRTRSILKGN